MKQRRLNRIAMMTLLASASVCVAQPNGPSNEAALDDKGNVYVVSRDGKQIRMSDTGHCTQTLFANDRQTVGCLVAVKDQGQNPDGPPPSVQLEIYLKGGDTKTIEAGAPIHEWHFWEDGQQVAISSGQSKRPQRYTLYESATARLIEELLAPAEGIMLPQWAKSQAQIDDESVPMGPSLTEERARWLAKTLRQIQKTEPGTLRKDLFPIFTTEGGLSTRFRRTYVFAECPYVKVDIRFKAANHTKDALTDEDPLDTVESVSRPYIAWGVFD